MAIPNLINGTLDNDLLFGTLGDDVIDAGLGNDLVVALGGDDIVNGGGGDDFIALGDGNDLGRGGCGTDYIVGGSGNDVIDGGADNDNLFGDDGDDALIGGDGNDNIYGDSFLDNTSDSAQVNGNDILRGGNGDDRVNGGAGNDLLFGEGNSDLLNGDDGDDILDGGEDDDALFGGSGNDLLFGNNGNDRLIGMSVDNEPQVVGKGEIDTLTGGLGNNTFVLGAFIINGNTSVFYNDGDPSTTGIEDYALITDFKINNDQIELIGEASNYSLGASPSDLPPGTAIFLNDETQELIGIVSGVSSSELNLSNPNQFIFG